MPKSSIVAEKAITSLFVSKPVKSYIRYAYNISILILKIGDKIIEHRKNQGYSQEELSNISGISLRTIQRIEKGQVNPRGYTLKTLFKSLQIEPDFRQENPTIDTDTIVKVRTLNSLGLLVALLPLLSTTVQIIYWLKNKAKLTEHHLSRKILSFQVLWCIVVFTSLLLIHITTYLITGQSVYGHFPIRLTAYLLLLLANISVIIYTALKLNGDSELVLKRFPSLI